MPEMTPHPACPAATAIDAFLSAAYEGQRERCYLDDEADADDALLEAEADTAAYEAMLDAEAAAWAAAHLVPPHPEDTDGDWYDLRNWDWADGPPDDAWDEGDE